MKFQFVVHSVPSGTIEERHQKLVRSLIGFDDLWGLSGADVFPVPDPGKELSARFSIGKFLGKGIKGAMTYRFRGGLRDISDCDDFLNLEFHPKKLDVGDLYSRVFPKYCEALDGYYGYIGNEEYVYEDFAKSRGFNLRHGILRIYEINFYSHDYLDRILSSSMDSVFESLEAKGLRRRELDYGVLLYVPSGPLSLNEGNILNSKAIEFFKTEK